MEQQKGSLDMGKQLERLSPNDPIIAKKHLIQKVPFDRSSYVMLALMILAMNLVQNMMVSFMLYCVNQPIKKKELKYCCKIIFSKTTKK